MSKIYSTGKFDHFTNKSGQTFGEFRKLNPGQGQGNAFKLFRGEFGPSGKATTPEASQPAAKSTKNQGIRRPVKRASRGSLRRAHLLGSSGEKSQTLG